MLRLKEIYKEYQAGTMKVQALKNVNLEFRKNEFVSILGPSGSGKTTLLNIIGGLDQYTSGDLLINGMSTELYKDNDWDSYRNTTIGFVFQNYYLIPHLSVLGNVEIALTLSGITPKERKKRAIEALKNVGLEDQITKKPNQLSGGQMQRVAIARALVNNPKIILADEPTGALDSVTSEQIMNILKEISKDRLIIMVSHNQDIAYKYSTRVVKLLDGEVIDDSNPYDSNLETIEYKTEMYNKGQKSSMSFFTALKLSFNNLRTKKTRTIITSIAGSIGIIGIALVLAIGNGMTNYINVMQSDALSGFPLTIAPQVFEIPTRENMMSEQENDYPEGDIIVPYDRNTESKDHINIINEDYVNYVKAMDKSLYNSISYYYGIKVHLVTKTSLNEYKSVDTDEIDFQELPNSQDFVESQYDVLYGTYPQNLNEAVLIIDKDNRVNVELLNEIGIPYVKGEELKFDDFIGKTLKLVLNDNYYAFNSGTNTYIPSTNYESMYNNTENPTVKITAILRNKETAANSMLNKGIAYSSELKDFYINDSKDSKIVTAQKNSTGRNVLTGLTFAPYEYEGVMILIGGNTTPLGIRIYPKSFADKESIKAYLDVYNVGKEEKEQIIYSDFAETIMGAVGTLINTISIILSAFAAISLIVSSIMIGIITYVSVVERIKEIGILRSLGARKKDISRVFNAETVIIGLTAGIIGILITLMLSIPINIIVNNKVQVKNIASLPFLSALILIVVSITLTFIAGLIPARIAANKDPVNALRTE